MSHQFISALLYPMSKMRQATFWLMVVIGASILISTGCGDGDARSDTTTSTEFASGVEIAPSDSVLASERTLKTNDGGVFKYPTRGNLIILDPAIGFTPSSRALYYEIYSGLMKIADDPAQPFAPELAERYTVRDGGSVYEFMLRQGLRFSDGSPVRASDFKWSWERALHPTTGATRASSILGSISGAQDVTDGSTNELSGVEVIDDRTLRVALSDPDSDFLANLAHPIASVLSESNVKEWGVDWSKWQESAAISSIDFNEDTLPVGTGPFKLSEYEFLGNLKLTRNEHYYGDLAKLDAVEFITDIEYEGESGRLIALSEAFERGDIDMMVVQPDDTEWLQTQFPDSSAVLQPYDARGVTEFIVFNTAIAPFDDVNFRRALALAIDVDSLADSLDREVAKGLILPELTNTENVATPLKFDPESAVSELNLAQSSDARIEDFIVKFQSWLHGEFEEEFKIIASDWNKHLGITAEYETITTEKYNHLADAGRIQMIVLLVAASFPGPGAIMDDIDFTIGGASEISDDAVAAIRMLETASTTTDIVERNLLYAEVEQHVIDTALVLPLFWHRDELIHRLQPWVQDFRVPKYGGSRFIDVWFDETSPER